MINCFKFLLLIILLKLTNNINNLWEYEGITIDNIKYDSILYKKFMNNYIYFIYKIDFDTLYFQKFENYENNNDFGLNLKFNNKIKLKNIDFMEFDFITNNLLFAFDKKIYRYYFFNLNEKKNIIKITKKYLSNIYLRRILNNFTLVNLKIKTFKNIIYIFHTIDNKLFYLKINYKINNDNIEIVNDLDLYSADINLNISIIKITILKNFIIFEDYHKYYFIELEYFLNLLKYKNKIIEFKNEFSKIKNKKYLKFYDSNLKNSFYEICQIKINIKNYHKITFYEYKLNKFFIKLETIIEINKFELNNYYFINYKDYFFYLKYSFRQKKFIFYLYKNNNSIEKFKINFEKRNFKQLTFIIINNNKFLFFNEDKIYYYKIFFKINSLNYCSLKNINNLNTRNNDKLNNYNIIIDYWKKKYYFYLKLNDKKNELIKYNDFENMELLNKQILLLEKRNEILFYHILYKYNHIKKKIKLNCTFYLKFYNFDNNLIFICFLLNSHKFVLYDFVNNSLNNSDLTFEFKTYLLDYKMFEYKKNIYLLYNEKNKNIKLINLYEENNIIKSFVIYEKKIIFNYKEEYKFFYSQYCLSYIFYQKIINYCFNLDKYNKINYIVNTFNLNKELIEKKLNFVLDFKYKVNLDNSFYYILALKNQENIFLYNYLKIEENNKINLFYLNINNLNDSLFKKIYYFNINNDNTEKNDIIKKDEIIKFVYLDEEKNKLINKNFNWNKFNCIDKNNDEIKNNNIIDFNKQNENYYYINDQNDYKNLYINILKLNFHFDICIFTIRLDNKNEAFNKAIIFNKFLKEYKKFNLFDEIYLHINKSKFNKNNEYLAYFNLIKSNKYKYFIINDFIFIVYSHYFIKLKLNNNNNIETLEFVNILEFKSFLTLNKEIINNFEKIKFKIFQVKDRFVIYFILNNNLYVYNENGFKKFYTIKNFKIKIIDTNLIYYYYKDNVHYINFYNENNLKNNNLIIKGRKNIIFDEINGSNIITSLMNIKKIHIFNFKFLFGENKINIMYKLNSKKINPDNLTLITTKFIYPFNYVISFDLINNIIILRFELNSDKVKLNFINIDYLLKIYSNFDIKKANFFIFKEAIFLGYSKKLFWYTQYSMHETFVFYSSYINLGNYLNNKISKINIFKKQLIENKKEEIYYFEIKAIDEKNNLIKLELNNFIKMKFKKYNFFSNYLVMNFKNFWEKFEKNFKIDFKNNLYKSNNYSMLFIKQLVGFILFVFLVFFSIYLIVKFSDINQKKIKFH